MLAVAENAWVRDVQLTRPSFEDNTADADRLFKAVGDIFELSDIQADLELIQDLPQNLRNWGFRVRCAGLQQNNSLIITSLDDPGDESSALGLAVDLGSSKYVLRVLRLQDGQILGEMAGDNPQTEKGADILTRIHYAESPGGLKELHNLIINDLNRNIGKLCAEQNLSPSRICNLALAGNTAMTHFFLGLNPYWMIREPYIPALNVPGLYKAVNLGLDVHPCARIYCFPNAGSYFGGDLFSGIIFSGMHQREDISLLVDVGTNAEVVLGNRDWMIACAGAAGPALEQGMSEVGMQAAPGVVDRVYIDAHSLQFEMHTLDDLPARGICGSGIIDLAAQLFKVGVLDFRGKFVPEKLPHRFREIDGIIHLIVVPAKESGTGQDLLVGQPEMDSLIRSKAAMFTILETLLTTVGIRFEDLSNFFIGGTFGSFIDPWSAVYIGMLPDLDLNIFQSLGNSSLEGATAVLKDRRLLPQIKSTRQRLTYLELNVNQEFMNRFSAAKFLPHTDKSRFPSVEVLH